MLYPIKFKPIYKPKVWGGDKIRQIKQDENVPNLCGESWEVSGLEGDVSEVANGFLAGNTLEEIIEVYMGDIVGDSVFEKYGYEFPILLKIIDAKENLSLQVHPNDDFAEKRHKARGKTEIWYALDVDENARLVSGFNQDVDADIFFKSIKDNTLDQILNESTVKSGDVFYIPAGRVHSIGKGNMIVEIQETSDITYRVYDYGRVDRELHLDLAKDVIDYAKTAEVKTLFSKIPNQLNKILSSQFFTINYYHINDSLEKDFYTLDSFVMYFCIKGDLRIKYDNDKYESLKKGESILIPAAINTFSIICNIDSELLEVYIDSKS